jgi:hypothetical protein
LTPRSVYRDRALVQRVLAKTAEATLAGATDIRLARGP